MFLRVSNRDQENFIHLKLFIHSLREFSFRMKFNQNQTHSLTHRWTVLGVLRMSVPIPPIFRDIVIVSCFYTTGHRKKIFVGPALRTGIDSILNFEVYFPFILSREGYRLLGKFWICLKNYFCDSATSEQASLVARSRSPCKNFILLSNISFQETSAKSLKIRLL